MTESNVLSEGIALYNQKKYSDALTFFLALPSDSGAEPIEIAYYLGLCYAKLEKYEDALLYLEQVVTSGNTLEKVLQCRFLLAIIYAIEGDEESKKKYYHIAITSGRSPEELNEAIEYFLNEVDWLWALFFITDMNVILKWQKK